MNNSTILAAAVTQALRRIRYHSDEVVLDSVEVTDTGVILLSLENPYNNQRCGVSLHHTELEVNLNESVNYRIDEAFRCWRVTDANV